MSKAITRSVALALALLPGLAAAQQPPQRPLVINPPVPAPAEAPRTAPLLLPERVEPASGGLKLLDLGATVSPSLSRPGSPDLIPEDRRQDRVPAVRFKIPL